MTNELRERIEKLRARRALGEYDYHLQDAFAIIDELVRENERLEAELRNYEQAEVVMRVPEKGHAFVPSLQAEEVCALCGEFLGCCTEDSYEG